MKSDSRFKTPCSLADSELLSSLAPSLPFRRLCLTMHWDGHLVLKLNWTFHCFPSTPVCASGLVIGRSLRRCCLLLSASLSVQASSAPLCRVGRDDSLPQSYELVKAGVCQTHLSAQPLAC